ncbi:PH domain-containing protein [Pseudozyma hubeiensis]|nr:PH domain-containing protein [Pseudozyma hubeiensis]
MSSMSMSMETQTQTQPSGLPRPVIETYDLASSSSSHYRSSYRNEDDLFDTLFPQPPPRSRTQAARLARPSLPLLRPSVQSDSADSSRSTAQPLSASNSIESVNSLSSYPSSTSSLSLLHSLQPYKQTSIDSSIDYYSPAVSDVNSAETDHSVSSGRTHSQSSDLDVHDQSGPFTPITPSDGPQTWRPKELNLVRRRQVTAPAETTLSPHAASTISGDRNALLIGLGLGGLDDGTSAPPSATFSTASNLPAAKLAQPSHPRGFLLPRSPQLGSTAAFSQDAAASQGPKQLLLVSSGGPPAVRRFPGRRPSEHLHEAFVSSVPTPPSESSSSRCNTPQMRSAIPVLPSGPAFVAGRPISPDPSTLTHADRYAGPSAQEFLAQIASTPQYQASEHFETAAFSPASASLASSPQPEQELALGHRDDRNAADTMSESTPTLTATPSSSELTAKAPGFSWTQRSRATSLSRRKAPPSPLVLTSSPATSNSDTLPGSADGRRRRSLTATSAPRSPLSAPHSANLAESSSASTSNDRERDSASCYAEPLRTAYYDFDTEEDSEHDRSSSGPASRTCDEMVATVPPSAGTTSSHRRASSSAASPPLAPGAMPDRNISDSLDSPYSTLSSRVTSLRSDALQRQSSASGSAAAFEFDDLETESTGDGLCLQTMMGFLQRQDSPGAADYSRTADDTAELSQGGLGTATPADSVAKQAAISRSTQAPSPHAAMSPIQEQAILAETPPPASANQDIPTFNLAIFGPSQSSETKQTPTIPASGIVAPQIAKEAPIVRPRKQSIVPAPPSFAIHDASRREKQSQEPVQLLPAISDSIDVRPVAMARANSNELGNSRWSSGSESDGQSALPTRAGRKSFSKGRKSFSASRKNSVANANELVNGLSNSREVAGGAAKMPLRRSSKARLSAQEDNAVQALSAPSKPSSSTVSKRLRLNGLASLRKKSFSNLSGQSASPSTPSGSRALRSAAPSPFGQAEFPFPPSAPTQIISAPAPPVVPSGAANDAGRNDLSIRTAFASVFPASAQASHQSPWTPISAPGLSLSNNSSGPLTTQQILAQARSNVWPENYIGTGVSSAGMSSPYLAGSNDTFNRNFAPSRLAPFPPESAPASRSGWSSAPVTPPMPQNSQFPVSASQEKSLPSTPSAEDAPMARTRSHTTEVAPPKNLRHIRKSSSNTTLGRMRRETPSDVFKPSEAKVTPVPHADRIASSSQPDLSIVHEEKLPTMCESEMQGTAAVHGAEGSMDADRPAALVPILVDRRQAKLKKALRIRQQNDRFPRRNSWTEYGLQWVLEQGADAFDTLAAEGLPSLAILAASGAPSDQSRRVLTSESRGGGGGGGDDSDASDTDDYGSSDGGGGGGDSGGFGGSGGAGGGKHPGAGRDAANDSDDDDEDDDEDEEELDEDRFANAMTDEDSEDDYGRVEPAAASRSNRSGPRPAVPARNASMPASAAQNDNPADSDSSDDRPLGQLVNDPKALQKALRAKERRRHFDMAAQALEGKGGSSASASASGHARRTSRPQGHTHANDAVVSPNELAQRLNKVQGRRERAHAQDPSLVQRSQTIARPDVGRSAAAVSRSKSVRTAPAERHVHPGMLARTPSEAALRAKAAAQAMPQGPSPISPMGANGAKMPELPPHAIATVVAAQKAMAHAQANPTPAAMAQAQALATSATAALNAATAQVKRGGASPISPNFSHGESVGPAATSSRLPDSAETPGARHRADSRGHAVPVASSGGTSAGVPALASAHQPGMLQRLRSRSVSRNQAPLTINTAAAPPMPDLPRPSTASKDSPASSSPHNVHTTTFAALSQAAMHHGRPSIESSSAHGDGQMTRGPAAMSAAAPSVNESSAGLGITPAEARQPHKVFILSRQRFTVVEVPVSARARDLALEVIERERLPMDDSKGGWVVFDCSAQLGIERPMREYEMVTEVMNVRAHPKTDYFLIKRTELSPYLSLRSVPSSSPALAGWVYVQDRKKKWNKRWLELRDHALYHAKNEKGKDEVSICQISTFDVYLVDSSAIKMPKANGFALRSQDPITMFEKPEQDYMHYFCLTDPAAHRDWVRAILNARTYILKQEKAVLFQIESPLSSQDAAVASGGLTRKNTSRRANGRAGAASADTSVSSSAVPAQPAPLIDSSAFAGPFAKGSLLADKAISDAKEALRGHGGVSPPTGALHEMSLVDRNALRANDARRRDEAIERQRRMRADGQPLIDLARR